MSYLTRAGVEEIRRPMTIKDWIQTYARELEGSDAERELEAIVNITEETSDGYHTFRELYKYRLLYNAALFNEWAVSDLANGEPGNSNHFYDVHKSWRHADGELAFGGDWFVVSAQLPTGQITNHYAAKYWDLFKIPAVEKAGAWDGHTPQEAAERMEAMLRKDTK